MNTSYPNTRVNAARKTLDAAVMLCGFLVAVGGFLGNEFTWMMAAV